MSLKQLSCRIGKDRKIGKDRLLLNLNAIFKQGQRKKKNNFQLGLELFLVVADVFFLSLIGAQVHAKHAQPHSRITEKEIRELGKCA